VECPGGGRITDKAAPTDIEHVRGPWGDRVPLRREAAIAITAMVRAARADGIPEPVLRVSSGYRTPEHQARLWAAGLKKHGSPAEARKWVAPPGTSPHQSGRAVDLHLGVRGGSGNVAQQRTTPAYLWLTRNASRFGFYPYPREPWHWEYNPPSPGCRPRP
jgi:LAS superfamily LD-carboxypeptidase LdcB